MSTTIAPTTKPKSKPWTEALLEELARLEAERAAEGETQPIPVEPMRSLIIRELGGAS